MHIFINPKMANIHTGPHCKSIVCMERFLGQKYCTWLKSWAWTAKHWGMSIPMGYLGEFYIPSCSHVIFISQQSRKRFSSWNLTIKVFYRKGNIKRVTYFHFQDGVRVISRWPRGGDFLPMEKWIPNEGCIQINMSILQLCKVSNVLLKPAYFI